MGPFKLGQYHYFWGAGLCYIKLIFLVKADLSSRDIDLLTH